jgi:hypothetical protein
MNADWNSNQKHIASSFLFSFSKMTSSRVAPPTAIITPATCYCCFPGFGNCTRKLSGAATARASGGGASAAAEAKDRKQEDRWRTQKVQRLSEGRSASLAKWRPLEIRSVSGAADQDSLFATCRSPGGTVCVRGRSASCWEAPTAQLQGVRSLSGANQLPLATLPTTTTTTPWRYGPCEGPISVLLPSTDPLEVWSGSGSRLPFYCQVPTPGDYGPCEGPMSILLRSASTLEIRSLSGAD